MNYLQRLQCLLAFLHSTKRKQKQHTNLYPLHGVECTMYFLLVPIRELAAKL